MRRGFKNVPMIGCLCAGALSSAIFHGDTTNRPVLAARCRGHTSGAAGRSLQPSSNSIIRLDSQGLIKKSLS